MAAPTAPRPGEPERATMLAGWRRRFDDPNFFCQINCPGPRRGVSAPPAFSNKVNVLSGSVWGFCMGAQGPQQAHFGGVSPGQARCCPTTRCSWSGLGSAALSLHGTFLHACMVPDSLRDSVPLFLKRRHNRTRAGARQPPAARGHRGRGRALPGEGGRRACWSTGHMRNDRCLAYRRAQKCPPCRHLDRTAPARSRLSRRPTSRASARR